MMQPTGLASHRRGGQHRVGNGPVRSGDSQHKPARTMHSSPETPQEERQKNPTHKKAAEPTVPLQCVTGVVLTFLAKLANVMNIKHNSSYTL